MAVRGAATWPQARPTPTCGGKVQCGSRPAGPQSTHASSGCGPCCTLGCQLPRNESATESLGVGRRDLRQTACLTSSVGDRKTLHLAWGSGL